MNTLTIENKEYVVITRKEYENLRTKAQVIYSTMRAYRS